MFKKLLKKSSASPAGSRLIPAAFEDEVSRFRAAETATAGIAKASKKLAEVLGDLVRADQRLEELTAESPVFAHTELATLAALLKTHFHTSVECAKSWGKNNIAVVDEPIRKFQKLFPAVNEVIKQHAAAAAEFERLDAKFEKHRAARDLDPAKQEKLERQRDAAERLWQGLDAALPSELPTLVEERVDFLNACLFGLVKAQISHLQDLVESLDVVIGDGSDQATADDVDAAETARQLNALRALSIVGTS